MSSRLDELFETAQGIVPERRDAWLDAACGDDVELRRRLQRLLDADARVDGILESASEQLICEALIADARTPLKFGVWRVLGALGAGGMGEVWLAERNDAGFVQRAAVKQVAWPTPGLLQRFQRERQILAQLQHPGIARLIDGGVDDDGCPYLAMEFVEGQPIDAWVREQALDVRATIKLILQVCEAVQFAHRNLVVHSDIKPSNILVTEDGKPRLLDFGIAKVLSEGDLDPSGTTTRLLTPDYAAPEWLDGGTPTTATDVYALGVLAYVLLSDNKPYRLGRGNPDVARQLADAQTRPPSATLDRNATNYRSRQRAVRGDLDRVVMTAMAHDPSRRYATVEALATDLRHWLDGRAINARGDNAWYRIRKFASRNRAAMAAVAAAVLVLISATAFSIRQAGIANREAARAKAVRYFLADTFAQIDPGRHHDGTVSLRKLLEQSERHLAEATDTPVSVRADLKTLIGTFYWNLADTVASARVLKAAVDLGASGGVDDEVQVRSLLALARVEEDRGNIDDAYRHASRARTLALRNENVGQELTANARRVFAALVIDRSGGAHAEPELRRLLREDRDRHGDRSQAVVDDLTLLGDSLDLQSRYDEAEAVLSEAVTIARNLDGPYRSRVGLALDLLGMTRAHRGDYTGAVRAYSECGTVIERLWGSDNPRASIVRRQLLSVAVQQGQLRQSLPAVLRMRDEAGRLKQARPNHYATSLELLGDVYLGLGKLSDAEEAFRQAMTQWHVVSVRRDTLDSADTVFKLAKTLKLLGRFAEAEQACLHAIRIDQTTAPSSQRLGRDLAELADVLRLRGQFSQALHHAQAAANILRSNHGSESPGAALILVRKAEALLDSGHPEEAHTQASAALAMAERVLPSENWQLVPAFRVMARTELAAGHAAKAEAALRQALALSQTLQPDSDPRVLDIQVTLIHALNAQGKSTQAASLRKRILPLLGRGDSLYQASLRRRLVAN